MTQKNTAAQIVLTRFEDIKEAGDKSKETVARLIAEFERLDRKTRHQLPVEMVEVFSGMVAVMRPIPSMIDAVKGIVNENVQLHSALQAGQLVQYGRPEDMA